MCLFRFVSISGCLFVVAAAWAQMTPNAPVKNFRFPRFSESGFTEWVLQGGEGIYDSEEQIRVKTMNLRVYSGDERLAQELGLKSPEATIRLKENRAFSKSRILIEGSNFTISGTGWNWHGDTKVVEVLDDVTVTFAQVLGDTLSGVRAGAVSPEGNTEIRSGRLILRTTETEYEFEFIGNVRVESAEMALTSGRLVAVAATPEGRGAKDAAVASSQKIEAVRSLRANENVVIRQGDRVARAEEATFDPQAGRVDLIGLPQIEASGAYISGREVRSQRGEIYITGGGDAGRAQVILSRSGGFGILGSESLSAETIVLADTIRLSDSETGNQFNFRGSVEVLSGPLLMKSEMMQIETKKADGGVSRDAGSGALDVGAVQSVVAEGSVEIERGEQLATAEKVVFYPDSERAELSGNPVVENGDAKIRGYRMELQPMGAHVRGRVEQPVVVILPVMPDLGYNPLADHDSIKNLSPVAEVSSPPFPEVVSTEAAAEPEMKASETVIRSDDLKMTENASSMFFRFSDNVSINATNLEATCGRLEVSADKKAGSGIEAMQVSQIDAIDEVRFTQSGRTATADKAIILPLEGKVILEGDATIADEQGTVTGHRVILNQGQRRAIVEGDGTNKQRAKITLPALPSQKP